MCHAWDEARRQWSTRGVSTVAPILGSVATDGVVHCEAHGVRAHSLAGLCIYGLLEPTIPNATIVMGLLPQPRGLSAGTAAVIAALILVTISDVLTVRWARQSRQKRLDPSERDPVWTPIIQRHLQDCMTETWRWLRPLIHFVLLVLVNCCHQSRSFARRSASRSVELTWHIRTTLSFACFAIDAMVRRISRAIRFALDSRTLKKQLAGSRSIRLDLEPITSIGERAIKPRDAWLRTLRRTTEPAKWLPDFIKATARVEALELLILTQNHKLGLSPEQLEHAATQVWTPTVRDALRRIATARKNLDEPLYSARVLEADQSTLNNGPIREVIRDLEEEVQRQSAGSPTFADLDVQPLVDFPPSVEGESSLHVASDADAMEAALSEATATETWSMTAERLKLVTLTQEYVEAGEIIVRLYEKIRINDVTNMLAEVSAWSTRDVLHCHVLHHPAYAFKSRHQPLAIPYTYEVLLTSRRLTTCRLPR